MNKCLQFLVHRTELEDSEVSVPLRLYTATEVVSNEPRLILSFFFLFFFSPLVFFDAAVSLLQSKKAQGC